MKDEYARAYVSYERDHWWFKARRVILKGLLNLHIPWKPGMRVVEIGTGPGENLGYLYPAGIDLRGIEPDPANAAVANAKGGAPVYVGTVEQMPVEIARDKQDLICLFDVLEHIQNDEFALDALREALADGGWLALSVPAYRWMWGQQDVVNMHCRRYTRGELRRKLENHGYSIVRATYFNSILFPPIALFRLLARLPPWKNRPVRSDFEYSAGPANRLLYALFRMEWPLLKWINLPVGGSCFVLARKDGGAACP